MSVERSVADQTELGRVLVTGGASGLGAAVVRAVTDADGEAMVLDLRQPVGSVEYEQVDLADPRVAEAAVHALAARTGGIDAVVTAAGTDSCGALQDVPAEDWERVLQVNLLSTAAVIRAALNYLARGRGRIVTVASTLGLRALSHASAYCASKFGVIGFTRSLAVELAGDIGVTLLIPGGMQTAFFNTRDPKYRPPADLKLNRPEDVASAVVFALRQPRGCEVRELVITPAVEPSWP